jgi:predicted RNase H-like HicB family nuclease
MTPPEESMEFKIDLDQEDDGRWIAEVLELPGTLAYGATPDEAKAKVQALALRVVADRLEHGEADSEFMKISFRAA